ncbi:MAG: hypothetical protein LC624_11305 [Halobacteriales archaeon]|nr:hypothetical protein [Halobacteriales archaeon]
MRLLLVLLVLAPMAAAQVPGTTSLALRWAPAEPVPTYRDTATVSLTYNWTGPAVTASPTRVTLDVRSGEAALNATCEATCVVDLPVDATASPTGGSAQGEAKVVVRWLFAPPGNASSLPVKLHAQADANGNLAAADAEGTMTVRYPGGLRVEHDLSQANPPGPPTPVSTPFPAWGLLGALGLAALRRVHGRA